MLYNELAKQLDDPSILETVETSGAGSSDPISYIGVDDTKYPEIRDKIVGTPEAPSDNIFRKAVERMPKGDSDVLD